MMYTTSVSAKRVDCLTTGLSLHKHIHDNHCIETASQVIPIIFISFQWVLWKCVINILNNLAASEMKRLLGTEQWQDSTPPVTYSVTG